MMGPLILIVLGVLVLMSNIFPGTFSFGRLWPVILIVIGVVKIVESLQRRQSGPSDSGPTGKDTP
jgi:uncharacterized membrane protein HdeD (DUF308 family)